MRFEAERMKRLFLLVVVLLFAASAGAQDGAQVPIIRSEADEAERTLEMLSRLPTVERRAIFATLTAEAKAGLWRAHLRRYLVEHSDLNDVQRAVISEALSLCNPELFEPDLANNGVPLRHIVLKALKDKALTVFSREAAIEVFAVLGSPAEHQAKPAASGATASRRFKAAPNDGELPYCGCNTWDDWCMGGWSCVGGGCYWQSSGCGTLWSYACTGTCKPMDPNKCGC